MPDKLQHLAMRMQLFPPQHLSDNIQELNSFLDHALRECVQPQVLPKQQKLPLNQHSLLETCVIMDTPEDQMKVVTQRPIQWWRKRQEKGTISH